MVWSPLRRMFEGFQCQEESWTFTGIRIHSQRGQQQEGGILKSYVLWMVALIICFFAATGWTQESAEESFNRGIRAVRAMEYEEAINAFRESVALRPNHEESYRNLGLVYIIQSKWDEGI